KLLEIYPPEEISREKILNKEQLQLLKQLFQEKNCKGLVKELIHLKKQGFKFPIENPYVSFLTHYEEAIDKNPKTIKKICDKLFEMNFNELREKLEAPKKASRRIGPMFKVWLKRKFNFLDINEFKKMYKFRCFLEGKNGYTHLSSRAAHIFWRNFVRKPPFEIRGVKTEISKRECLCREI
ncbi:MAG: hypothetical protein QW273_03885, partial [Candidatus Pacearchaeota archaeon]